MTQVFKIGSNQSRMGGRLLVSRCGSFIKQTKDHWASQRGKKHTVPGKITSHIPPTTGKGKSISMTPALSAHLFPARRVATYNGVLSAQSPQLARLPTTALADASCMMGSGIPSKSPESDPNWIIWSLWQRFFKTPTERTKFQDVWRIFTIHAAFQFQI